MKTKLNFKQCLAIKPEQTKKRYSLGNKLLIETNSISKKGKKYFIGRYRSQIKNIIMIIKLERSGRVKNSTLQHQQ